ncbi:prostaglandin E synthase-like [Pseudomyrmex gracilis]|uniref:prostaglandin E synthase-like n=1 Tax=Pseudomyrmex gracilis TaxID=219809 RepID=UPI000994E76D|nr:prostaglandin E synthase-like [Pseudomyrmex gracilis]
MLSNATAKNEEQHELWWSIYAWWSCVLVLKMMYLTWRTGKIRVEHQVIHSEEDKMWMTKKPEIILCPTGNGHPDVERIRYAHQKDLETILPFLIIVPLWLNVETCNFIVRVLIPTFALANILYTSIHMQLLQMSSRWKSYSFMTMYSSLSYICITTAVEYSEHAITLPTLAFSFSIS